MSGKLFRGGQLSYTSTHTSWRSRVRRSGCVEYPKRRIGRIAARYPEKNDHSSARSDKCVLTFGANSHDGLPPMNFASSTSDMTLLSFFAAIQHTTRVRANPIITILVRVLQFQFSPFRMSLHCRVVCRSRFVVESGRSTFLTHNTRMSARDFTAAVKKVCNAHLRREIV